METFQYATHPFTISICYTSLNYGPNFLYGVDVVADIQQGVSTLTCTCFSLNLLICNPDNLISDCRAEKNQ
jgi:hypothetical protein